MKSLKALTLIVALLLLMAQLAAVKPTFSLAPVYYSVEPKAIPPLTDIDPRINNLETPEDPSPVGKQFVVEIRLRGATSANVPAGVAGIEVHFYFGNILEYAKPVGFENFVAVSGGVLNPAVLYGIDPSFYNDAGEKVTDPPYIGATYYKVAAASTGPVWNGEDGLVVKITFEIIKQPSGLLFEPPVSFPLEMTFTDLVDGDVVPVPHDRVNGNLKINPSPYEYPPRPYIFVDPATKTGTMGEIFTVNVKINADHFWDVAGFDITFVYDPTLISLINVSEGNFLKQHGEETFGWIDDTTPGQVWAVFTKLENPAPSGGIDTLITMQFEVIYEHDTYPPPTCALGLINTDLASWAHPERGIKPWENRITAVQLPYDPRPSPPAEKWTHYTIDGLYTAPYVIPGPAVDVYTQYQAPYGGQGPNEHSDAFAPQMMVWLYAKVTYAGDRVTNKLVTFEIFNALDERVTILSNYSDINGIATVNFRIPQTDLIPGGEDPAIFGWWSVIATVEISEVVVNDTLRFQVGWLVKVVSIEPLNAPYLKYEDQMQFRVTIETISEQLRHALIVVNSFDAENYPIGQAVWEGNFNATRILGGTTPGVYTNTLTMSIPTWCLVGVGTVRAVALTGFPINGGTAYCPVVSALFGIKIT